MHAVAKTLFAVALFGASLTGVAYARDQVITARLAQPVAERTQVISENTLWRCEGDTCQAVSRRAASVRTCRQLVREVGPLTAFGPESASLTSEELARCNGDAQTQQAQN